MKLLLARMVVVAIAFVSVELVMDTVSVSGGFLGALGLAIIGQLLR